MAASKRAQELAAELMRIEDHLPTPTPSRAAVTPSAPAAQFSGAGRHFYSGQQSFSRQHYSGAKLDSAKAWIKAKYEANPKLYVIGGISVVIAAAALIGFAVYRKNKKSEDS
jgi:hypothetical protein